MRQKFSLLFLLFALCILAVEILIAVKFTSVGVMRGSVSDVLAVLFLYCVIRSFVAMNPFLLGLFVFIFACLIEATQYFRLSALLGLRSNGFLGILLGRTFSWGDILMYFIGCLIAFLGDRYLFRNRVSFTE